MKLKVIIIFMIFFNITLYLFSKDEIYFKVSQYGENGNIKDMEIIKNSAGHEEILYAKSFNGKIMEGYDGIKNKYNNYIDEVRYYYGDMGVTYFILKNKSDFVLYKMTESECDEGTVEKIKVLGNNISDTITKGKKVVLQNFDVRLYIEEGVNNCSDNYCRSEVYLLLGKYYKEYIGKYSNYFYRKKISESVYKVPDDSIGYYSGWFAGQGTDLFIVYNGSELMIKERGIDEEGSELDNSKIEDRVLNIYAENAKINIEKEIKKEIESYDIKELRLFYSDIGKWNEDKKKTEGKVIKIFRDKTLIKVEDRSSNIYKEIVYFDRVTFIYIKDKGVEKRYYYTNNFLFRYMEGNKIFQEEIGEDVKKEAEILYEQAYKIRGY